MPGQDKSDTSRHVSGTESSQKDIAKKNTSDILKYVDNQTLRTNPFESSLTAEQIYKRAERIAAALFLISTHVPDREPLKTSIREGAVRLIDQAMRIRVLLRAEESHEAEEFLGTVRLLISEVRLLGVAGYASHPNATLLVSAIDELGHLLTSAQRSSLSEFRSLAYEDLVPRIESTKPRRSPPSGHSAAIKDTMSYKAQSDAGSRSDRILALLKTSDLLGIKDISVNLPEFSEKMIQRELADLVQEGRVRKVGAKRWSRYGFVR